MELKKCFKSFLMAKKLIDSDKDKSFEYFKQSLKYINLAKKNVNDKDISDLLEETETECNKYINLTVEKTIEREDDKVIDLNLFDIIEKGELDLLKNIKSYHLNFNVYDEEGNTPIHKAIKYGDTTFIKMGLKLGAPIDIVNKAGNTALEYACLEKDPNMIEFLLKNGSDMKKHLLFREGNKKNKSNQNYIDCSIILKIIFSYPEAESYEELNFLLDVFKKDELIGFNEYTYLDLIKCLITLLNKINKDNKETYLLIIREELVYPLKASLGCPRNKLEILLTYLVPFIEYPFNVSEDWYINLELKYLIIKNLKQKDFFKTNLLNFLWENYIKNNILQDEYLGNLISQWVSKIKV
jgi:ankyrin repeat protein